MSILITFDAHSCYFSYLGVFYRCLSDRKQIKLVSSSFDEENTLNELNTPKEHNCVLQHGCLQTSLELSMETWLRNTPLCCPMGLCGNMAVFYFVDTCS